MACRAGGKTYAFDPVADIAYIPSGQNFVNRGVSRGIDVSQLQKVTEGHGFLELPPVNWPTPSNNVPVDNDF